jgi:MFS family permease
LAAITLAGQVRVWIVFVSAGLGGVVSVIDVPTRQAFASELVGPELLTNAVGLSSSVNNAARAVGPALAGVIIAATHNSGWCFAYNSFSYLVAFVAILMMNPTSLQRSKRVVRAGGQVRAGLAYVRGHPDLAAGMVIITVVGVCSLNFLTLMPLLASDTFHAGAATFGALTSALGIGSLVGALLVARYGKASMRLVVGTATGLGVMMLAVAAAPVVWVALIALVICGVVMTGFLASANTFLQLRAEPQMRGRVMSLYSLVIIGSSPIGGPLLALLSEHTSPRIGFVFGGVVALLAALVSRVRFARPREAARC